MVYANQPQTSGTGSNPNVNTTYERSWQDSRKLATASQAIQSDLPGAMVIEVFYGSNGQPSKIYVKDTQGTLHTVTFNSNQQITNVMSGCH